MKLLSPGLAIFLFGILLFTSGCLEEDPCTNEPIIVIDYSEPIVLKIHTLTDSNIFAGRYDIDSLIILENGDTMKFKYFSADSDSLIKFTLASFSTAYIWESFGKIMNTQLIFRYDSINSDTLEVVALPISYDETCPKTMYQFIELKLNKTPFMYVDSTTCIACGDTLTIKVK